MREEFLDKNKDLLKYLKNRLKLQDLENNVVSILNYIIEDIITTYENKIFIRIDANC